MHSSLTTDISGSPRPLGEAAAFLLVHVSRLSSPTNSQVIARPKLATPTIYQHARSPANDHSSLGLGETTPPTTTRAGFRAESRNRRSTTRQSDASWNADDSGSWAQDGDRGGGGFSGRIRAWGKDEGHQHDEQARSCTSLSPLAQNQTVGPLDSAVSSNTAQEHRRPSNARNASVKRRAEYNASTSFPCRVWTVVMKTQREKERVRCHSTRSFSRERRQWTGKDAVCLARTGI